MRDSTSTSAPRGCNRSEQLPQDSDGTTLTPQQERELEQLEREHASDEPVLDDHWRPSWYNPDEREL